MFLYCDKNLCLATQVLKYKITPSANYVTENDCFTTLY